MSVVHKLEIVIDKEKMSQPKEKSSPKNQVSTRNDATKVIAKVGNVK